MNKTFILHRFKLISYNILKFILIMKQIIFQLYLNTNEVEYLFK